MVFKWKHCQRLPYRGVLAEDKYSLTVMVLHSITWFPFKKETQDLVISVQNTINNVK